MYSLTVWELYLQSLCAAKLKLWASQGIQLNRSSAPLLFPSQSPKLTCGRKMSSHWTIMATGKCRKEATWCLEGPSFWPSYFYNEKIGKGGIKSHECTQRTDTFAGKTLNTNTHWVLKKSYSEYGPCLKIPCCMVVSFFVVMWEGSACMAGRWGESPM